MSAINDKALSVKPWILEVAFLDSSIPTLADDQSNLSAYKTALDNLTYIRGASVIDTTVTDDFGAKVTKIEADDTGTIYSEFEPELTIAGSIYELDKDFLNKVYPNSLTTIAGTIVSSAIQATVSWNYGFNQFIKIENQNGDGSAITVNSVTGWTDWALVADTDFYIGTNWAGEHGIFIIDSVTVTTMAQVFTIDYDYTPNESTIWAIVKKGQTIPKLVVRVKAMYTATQSKIDYLVDCWFEGQLIKKFSDVSRSGEIWNSAFNFITNRQWVHVFFDDYNV